MATAIIRPTSASSGYGWTNFDNVLGEPDEVYATGTTRSTKITLTVNFTNSLPSNAVISSVKGYMTYYVNSTSGVTVTMVANGNSTNMAVSTQNKTSDPIDFGTSIPSVVEVSLSTTFGWIDKKLYIDAIWFEVTYNVPGEDEGIPIYLGDTQISSIYVGSTPISEVYIGRTKIYGR